MNLSGKETIRVNLRLYKQDIERLKAMFPTSLLGYNAAIREIVHRHLNAIDASTNKMLENEPDVQLYPIPPAETPQ